MQTWFLAEYIRFRCYKQLLLLLRNQLRPIILLSLCHYMKACMVDKTKNVGNQREGSQFAIKAMQPVSEVKMQIGRSD
jgi:hypothetical protein